MRSTMERYRDDPVFRQMVDVLYQMMVAAETTPMEVREAAMTAQIMYEERHVRPIIVREVRHG